jgi:hypothetical protein
MPPGWFHKEGGDDHGKLGLLFLAGEGAEDQLDYCHAAEIDRHQQRTEQTVDERAGVMITPMS